MEFMDQIFSFQIGDIIFFSHQISKFQKYQYIQNSTNHFHIKFKHFHIRFNQIHSSFITLIIKYQISNAQLGGTFQMGG